jgi:hypothetical protein
VAVTVREQDPAADPRCPHGLATNRGGAAEEGQDTTTADNADGGRGAAWSGAIIAWLPREGRARTGVSARGQREETRGWRGFQDWARGAGSLSIDALPAAPPVALAASRPWN